MASGTHELTAMMVSPQKKINEDVKLKKKKKKSISDLCQNKITKTYKIVVSNGTRA